MSRHQPERESEGGASDGREHQRNSTLDQRAHLATLASRYHRDILLWPRRYAYGPVSIPLTFARSRSRGNSSLSVASRTPDLPTTSRTASGAKPINWNSLQGCRISRLVYAAVSPVP